MKVRTGLFRFVPWDQLDSYHRRGWMAVADLGLTHGFWSVLMWRCDCGEGEA